MPTPIEPEDIATFPLSRRANLRMFIPIPGSLNVCTTEVAETAERCLGHWWESAEAEAARAALDKALQSCAAPLPLWSLAQDLVHFVPHGKSTRRLDPVTGFRMGTVLCRRTAFTTGAPPGPPPPSTWLELDTSQKPSALLLTHTFADVPVPGSTLTLRTLFLADVVFEVPPEAMVAEIFPKTAPPPALALPELQVSTATWRHALTTEVVLNDEILSAAQLGALPARARRAVDAARRTQLLSTLRECVGAARWPGGFTALRHLAEEAAGGEPVRFWTEPLALLLLRARTDGEPTYDIANSLETLAGAHLGAGRIAEAAAYARQVCEAHTVSAAKHGYWTFGGQFEPPTVWYHLSTLEFHLQRFAAAAAAAKTGLEALDVGCADYAKDGERPPLVFQELRIQLPVQCLLATYEDTHTSDHELLLRLFREHAGFKNALVRRPQPVHLQVSRQRISARLQVQGTVYSTRRTNVPHAPWEIIEVPPGTPLPVAPLGAGGKRFPVTDARCVPDMAAACCAGCGAAAGSGAPRFKMCGACSLINYCSACTCAALARQPPRTDQHALTCGRRRQGVPGGALAQAQARLQKGARDRLCRARGHGAAAVSVLATYTTTHPASRACRLLRRRSAHYGAA